MELTIYTDGASRNNPGESGAGVYILRDGEPFEQIARYLGTTTNNVAEYNGLLAALRWAVEHHVTTLHIRADSELLVKQMTGQYRVKHPGLLQLYGEARQLSANIGRVTFEHVRREFNKEADRLCNEAMDEAGA